MAITAALVKELRERTGAGMMDCKKALTATDGDMDKAVDVLREKGLAAAAKKASRIAAEGAVASFVSPDGKVGVIVEVNCETDFVAKTPGFQDMAKAIAKQIAVTAPADVAALLASEMDGQTVSAVVTAAIAKIGENMAVRRFARLEAAEDGLVAAYIHMGGKIGTLVNLVGGSAELGKDLAMQVAAANPQYLTREQVPADVLEHEKAVQREKARNEGKPDKIIEKMVMGRIQKFYKDVCLVDQEFVKDPDLTVAALLKQKAAKVSDFARFQLGEGIEKKKEDFAAEVMSQIK